MATGSAVLEDGSWLSRLDRLLLPIERVMALASGLAAFSLMFLAAWSVTGRKFFGSPLLGYVDYIQLLMPLIAIFGVSYVQRDGTHIRMDIIIGRLRGRVLWLIEMIMVILVLLLMIGLIWGSWAHFERSFDFGSPMWSRDSTIDVGAPVWPSKILVPVAFAVLSARLVIQIIGYGRAFVLGLEHPVAVPLVQSAAEVAAAEAETLDGAD
ncbi:MAG: TRAP transporter small permease subunit [Paracoccaceae bacterium]|nr:TRAP transporter small permease [Marinibacterium sp.]